MAKSTPSRTAKTTRAALSAAQNAAARANKRNAVVFGSLLAVLTGTSALLLVMAPEPLKPDRGSSLMAVDAAPNLDAIFKTQTRLKTSAWKYLYIHHTGTTAGNATMLAGKSGDTGAHFLIGNGEGCGDGEIQLLPRWNNQEPPHGQPNTNADIDPACITISLVGNLDEQVPTPMQVQRLTQLVKTLQARLDIPSANVLLLERTAGPVGCGKFFPAAGFRSQLPG